MSKSRKRMMQRLTLVTVVVVLGVIAIFQSQRMARSDATETPTPVRDGAEPRGDADTAGHVSRGAAVVRGNNDLDDEFSSGGGFVPSAPSSDPASEPPPALAPPPADPQIFRETVGSGRAETQDQRGDTFNAPPALAPPPSEVPELPETSGDATLSDDSGGFQPSSSLPPPAELAEPPGLRSTGAFDPAASTQSDAPPLRSQQQDRQDEVGYPRQVDSQSHAALETSLADDPDSGRLREPSLPPRNRFSGSSASAETGSASPGPKHLEGLQTPSIALLKQAPPEIQVSKPATFLIKVQNVGQVSAENVTVYDRVPGGTRFLDAAPQAERLHNDSLIWRLGKMNPGEEKTISIELLPLEEGEIGSVARVSIESQASVRTICTRPQLELQLTAPPKVLIGQAVAVGIRISNPGTGAAEGVILEENVPENFSHPAGAELEFEVGTLRPGESRTATLNLRAEKAGIIDNIVQVRGAGNLSREEKVTIQVVAPEIDVAVNGPTKRFLERRADYAVAISNPGTAPARNVEMTAFLHKGMKFIEANNQGQYDAQNHAVHWSLEELPAGQRGSVSVSVLPIETGKQRLRVESRADLGLATSQEHDVTVDGLASLFFEVVDTADPIEVGSDTVYRVRVINQGSKAATNVKVFAALPGGMKPIGADGPSGHQINGQSVIFDGIARLEPKAEAMFQIQARGVQDGRHQIRIQMVSDSSTSPSGQTTPVSKEESTLVYADR